MKEKQLPKIKLPILMTVVMFFVCIGAALAIPLHQTVALAAGPTTIELSGSGTENDPWLIGSDDDLATLRDYIAAQGVTKGKYFKIEKDIALEEYYGEDKDSFAPIGVYAEKKSYYFAGVLDGDGHKITGLYIKETNQRVGLFRGTDADAVIMNLSVEGTVEGSAYVGGIVGSMAGKIENCTFNGTVTGIVVNNSYNTTLGSYVGGISGSAGKNAGITACAAEGDIRGNRYLGGIAGYAGCNIEKCDFKGNVTGKGTVGGIVGDNTNKGLTITECSVEGTVVATEDRAGGIGGWLYVSVDKCSFNGSVKSSREAGGIVGCAGQSGSDGNAAYTDCIVEGSVTGVSSAGGIAGAVQMNDGIITGCKNYSTVNCDNSGGGIAGSSSGTIKDCENHGDVKEISDTSSDAGGIAGTNYGSIEGCKNYGDVSTGLDDAGGIVGDAEGTIKDCYNYGKIKGRGEVGGIAGVARAAIMNCVNEGELNAEEDSVGSLAGCSYYAYVKITTDPNGAPGKTSTDTCYTYPANAPECPYTMEDKIFLGWNTASDGSGTYYQAGKPYNNIEKIQATLYAIWMDCSNMNDLSTAGTKANPWIIDPAVRGLVSGWYITGVDSGETGKTLELNERLKITGEVNLVLADNVKLDVTKGINVSEGNSLIIHGNGELNATGTDRCAGIGGSAEEGCGIVTIEGGTVTAKGNSGAAGIGGGDCGDGGTVTVKGGNVLAEGSTCSSTGLAAPGIGAGRPGTDSGSTVHLKAGILHVYDGTVTAIAGTPLYNVAGAQAIGVNLEDKDSYDNNVYKDHIKIFRDDYVVFAGEDKNTAVMAPFSDKLSACTNAYVSITRCPGHSFVGRQCKYCGDAIGHSGEDGTGIRPFTIQNKDDWDKLASFIELGFETSGKQFELINDISVTTMIGTMENPFEGCLNGGGHALIANISENDNYVAPFKYINNSEIVDLVVTGSVTGDLYCAGLAGLAEGKNYINNCLVSARVDTTADQCGGIISCVGSGETTLRNCVFAGGIYGALGAGTIVGLNGDESKLTLTGCIDISDSEFPVGLGTDPVSISNTYYTYYSKITDADDIWTDCGKRAYSVTAGEGVELSFGSGTTSEVTGITYHNKGFSTKVYNFYDAVDSDYEAFYAGSGDKVELTIKGTVPEGSTLKGYVANEGTLTKSASGFTLTMPAGNVVISMEYETPDNKPTASPNVTPTKDPSQEGNSTAEPTKKPGNEGTPTADPSQNGNSAAEPTKVPANNGSLGNSSGSSSSGGTTMADPSNAKGSNGGKNKSQSNKIKIVSVTCKKGTKTITGKLSVKGATVKIKVGKKAYKKAKVKGKKFSLNLSYKLQKKTKITIKVTKKKSGITKTYKVK